MGACSIVLTSDFSLKKYVTEKTSVSNAFQKNTSAGGAKEVGRSSLTLLSHWHPI